MKAHDAQALRFRLGPVDALSISWNACFSNLGPFVGFVVLFYIASFMLSLVPFVGWVSNLFGFVICSAMFSGFQSVAQQGKASFDQLFSWTPRFGKLLGGYVLLFLIAVALFVPVILFLFLNLGLQFFTEISKGSTTYLASLTNLSGFFLLGLFLLTIAAFMVLSVLSFAYVFILQYKDLGIGESLKLSIAVGRENLGHIIVFVLLVIGLVILGFLACFVGLLVVVPLIYGMQYHMLRSIFPDEQKEHWDFMDGKTE